MSYKADGSAGIQATELGRRKPLLLSPLAVGPYWLSNRVVMAPMTRSRAGEESVPTALTAAYYAQRASAGLVITEATQVSPRGVGYPDTPGIHTDRQVEGWRRVTDAVHARGGHIFLQLWHVGRVSHPSMQPNGDLPLAPSAIAPQGRIYTSSGWKPFVTPRALQIDEIPAILAEFAAGAWRAWAAGFDGVELHAANGYLIDQFLRDGSNRRTDRYGGPVENRARFLLEVLEAVSGIWGSERVGVRLSPVSAFNDMSDSDPAATFGYAASALRGARIAYLHVVGPDPVDGQGAPPENNVVALMRAAFGGPFILNNGYHRDSAEEALRSGRADLVSFGRLFLANPDLPERFALRAPLNEPDPTTFYGGGERGYTDYPTWERAEEPIVASRG